MRGKGETDCLRLIACPKFFTATLQVFNSRYMVSLNERAFGIWKKSLADAVRALQDADDSTQSWSTFRKKWGSSSLVRFLNSAVCGQSIRDPRFQRP